MKRACIIIERRTEEEQNLDVTKEKSLEVLEAARNANPPASLTSCVSINPQPFPFRSSRRPSSFVPTSFHIFAQGIHSYVFIILYVCNMFYFHLFSFSITILKIYITQFSFVVCNFGEMLIFVMHLIEVQYEIL